MYLQGTDACNLPNSETPMSQQRIDAQNVFIAAVGSAFESGDDALDSLIQALGGNPAGQTVSGASGVPTTGTLDLSNPGIPVVPNVGGTPMALLPDVNDPSYWGWAPSPSVPLIVPGSGSGYPIPQGIGRGRRYTNAKPVSGPCPTIVPLVTAIPVPPPPAVMQQTQPPPQQPAPTQTAPAAPLPDCRTGNWCLDIRNGCVLPSQVSPEQLQICSQAGYAGARSLYPQIAAHGGVSNGEFFGTPEPNPPPYDPMGMSGFGDSAAQSANANLFSGIFEGVVGAIATTVALAILMKGKKFA